MSGDIRQTSSNSLLNQTPIKTKPYSSNAISIQVSKQSTSGKSSIHEKHLQSTDMIRDIVIGIFDFQSICVMTNFFNSEGMSDGLTVPFALAAGILFFSWFACTSFLIRKAWPEQ